MTTGTSSLDSSPTTTSNNLADIIGWLKEGDYVVVYNTSTKTGRFFHKCLADTKTSEELAKSLDNCRVTYVNVASLPGLLDDGEWNWYIKQAGFDECTCSLKDRVSTFTNIPHQHMLKLGF